MLPFLTSIMRDFHFEFHVEKSNTGKLFPAIVKHSVLNGNVFK